MIALGHTSVGVIIGLGTAATTPGLPWWLRLGIALVAGVLSHYVFDWLPHGHYHHSFLKITRRMVLTLLADSAGVVALFLALGWWQFGLGLEWWLIGTGIAGALAPDVWDGMVRLGLIPPWRWVRRHTHFHHKVLHWHSNPVGPQLRLARPISGSDVWQLAVFGIAIFLVLAA